MKLNLGCGSNKIDGFINIDVNEAFKPDLVHDFVLSPLPYEAGSAEEIVLFHTIEHIEKWKHPNLLSEIRRVLRDNGLFFVSFPEFSCILQNWLENKRGDRQFWEHTIYGRQSSKADYHVSAMDTDDFTEVLRTYGFKVLRAEREPLEDYNTIIKCMKAPASIPYERVVYEDMVSILK